MAHTAGHAMEYETSITAKKQVKRELRGARTIGSMPTGSILWYVAMRHRELLVWGALAVENTLLIVKVLH